MKWLRSQALVTDPELKQILQQDKKYEHNIRTHDRASYADRRRDRNGFFDECKERSQKLCHGLTECGTPEIKQILMKQLDEAIDSHEKITSYMIQRGSYHPHHIPEQIQLDLKNIQTAMNIPS